MKAILGCLQAGDLVLASSPRLARHWRWHFDRSQFRAGHGGWISPEVLTLDAWLDQAWEQAVIRGTAASRYRPLTPAQSRCLWRQVLDSGDQPAPTPLLALARRAWRLTRDWRIPLDTLARRSGTPESEAFAAWSQAYADACETRGWVDPGDLAAILIPDITERAIPVPPRMLMVGFEPCTPAVERLVDALRAAGSVVELHRPMSAGAVAVRVSFTDSSAESRRASAWAAGELTAHPDHVIGLVMTGSAGHIGEMRRLLLDAVRPDWREQPLAELPVQAGREPPLASHGLVHTALLALQLASGRTDFRDFGQLLRSPYLAGFESEFDARARLDLRIRDSCQRELELWDLRALIDAQAPGFGRLLMAALTLGHQAPGSQEPGVWVGWIDHYLREFGWLQGRALQVDEQLMVTAWQRLLEDFAACGMVTGPVSLAGAVALLAGLARDRQAPGTGRAGGVQILTAAELPGYQFDSLWIAGMSSDAWPVVQAANPLVPMALQREAGVPGTAAASAAAAGRELAETLWHSATRVIASCAHRDGAESRLPSPLLGPLTELDADALSAASHPTLRDRLLWTGELELPADSPPSLQAGEPVHGGSRLLQLQGACPARAFYELRLGAREIETPSLGIDARTRGMIAHAALENLYQALVAACISPADATAQEHVAGAVDSALAGRLHGSQPLVRVALGLERNRLRRLLNELLILERARPDFKVIGSETPVRCVLGPLELRLRPDRLDRTSSGQQVVFDYKTGGKFGVPAWLGTRPAEPQLPLYAIAAGVDAIGVVQLSAEGVSIVGLAADADCGIPGFRPADKLPARYGIETWPMLMATWRENLTALAEEFAAGSCRIDRRQPRLAAGQWTVLTRLTENEEETG